jgi:hypothetical protein
MPARRWGGTYTIVSTRTNGLRLSVDTGRGDFLYLAQPRNARKLARILHVTPTTRQPSLAEAANVSRTRTTPSLAWTCPAPGSAAGSCTHLPGPPRLRSRLLDQADHNRFQVTCTSVARLPSALRQERGRQSWPSTGRSRRPQIPSDLSRFRLTQRPERYGTGLVVQGR